MRGGGGFADEGEGFLEGGVGGEVDWGDVAGWFSWRSLVEVVWVGLFLV